MDKIINIGQLKPGMVIIKIIAQNGPVKIRKSGLVSSVEMVKALSEMGVLEVEIDPEITVEMTQPTITKSKTQQLLEGNKTPTYAVENSISEQFNRNLFLPSVQEIPEAWQYYGNKVALIFVVILAGLGSGFSISQFPVWIQGFSFYKQIVQSPVQNQQVPQDSIEDPETTTVEQTQIQQGESQRDDSKVQTGATNQNDSETPQLAVVDTSELEQASNVDASPVTPEPEPQATISPELLKRFQDAVASLDIQQAENGNVNPSGTGHDPDYQNEIIRDVKPIHKLTARTLTRLPSMVFSTHMYASAPQDRWVKVNGKRIIEGQEIERGLVLIGIEPQHVILNFEGQEFRMDALTDW